MSLEIKGIITEIHEVETGTSKAGKEWKKQSFVINTGDQFNPEICFSVFGEDKVDKIAKFNKVGQEVNVKFNVSSKEFNGKWYHSLDAWYIENADATIVAQPTTSESLNGKKSNVVLEDDTLPF